MKRRRGGGSGGDWQGKSTRGRQSGQNSLKTKAGTSSTKEAEETGDGERETEESHGGVWVVNRQGKG